MRVRTVARRRVLSRRRVSVPARSRPRGARRVTEGHRALAAQRVLVRRRRGRPRARRHRRRLSSRSVASRSGSRSSTPCGVAVHRGVRWCSRTARRRTTKTWLTRLRAAGAIPVGLCTASEFGGLNVSKTKLNGITRNRWNTDKTVGGSSGGSSAAVSGGLVPIASGGDGGGSIRIPAAFNGLRRDEGHGRTDPARPQHQIAPMTVVLGCQARSVRDVARWYDVCAGYDSRDPYSLPKIDGWERDLGTSELKGLRATISPNLGTAVVRDEVAETVREAAEQLAKDVGLELVDVPVKMPEMGYEWAVSNLVRLHTESSPGLWPDCKDQLTDEIAFGMTISEQTFNLEIAGRVEAQRTEANEIDGGACSTRSTSSSARRTPMSPIPRDVTREHARRRPERRARRTTVRSRSPRTSSGTLRCRSPSARSRVSRSGCRSWTSPHGRAPARSRAGRRTRTPVAAGRSGAPV